MRPRISLYFAKPLSSRSWQSFVYSKMSHMLFFQNTAPFLSSVALWSWMVVTKWRFPFFYCFKCIPPERLWRVCIQHQHRLKVETPSGQLLSPLSPHCLLCTTLWSLFISPFSWDHSRAWASLSLRSKKGGHVSFPYWRQRHVDMYACPNTAKNKRTDEFSHFCFLRKTRNFILFYY